MLTAQQLIELIQSGESSKIELKEVRIRSGKVQAPHRRGISDEFAAFANASGGIVIFGVSDKDRNIIGIKPAKVSYLVDWITEVCNDSISPPIARIFVDSVFVLDGKGKKRALTYVEIEPGLWIHKSANGYFHRIGSSKREMSTEYLLRMIQSRSQARITSFDEQAVPHTNESTLQPYLYKRFVTQDSTKALKKRRLLVGVNGKFNASVAGILMCTESPDEFIYNSFIQAVFYRSDKRDANYQINALDCRGPLDRQIKQAYDFVKQHNFVSAIKKVWREERPQYSLKAVFEAIVNAVVHSDYSIYGSKIRLFMYSDRLEIISPGELANTLTVDMLKHNQVTRNEMLARFLSELPVEDAMGKVVNRTNFLERRGEGVTIILDESEQLSGKLPVYEMLGKELKLTIFAAPSLHEMQ